MRLYSQEHDQTLSGLPLSRRGSFPPCTLAIHRDLHFSIPITLTQRVLFSSFLFKPLLLGLGVGLSQKSSMFLPLNYASAVIGITSNVISKAFLFSTAVAQIVDLHIVSGDSTHHKKDFQLQKDKGSIQGPQQHGPRRHYGLR